MSEKNIEKMPEITREMILAGKDYTKFVEVPGYGAKIKIRSLTDLELAEVINLARKNNWLQMFDHLAAGGSTSNISAIADAVPLMIEMCVRGAIVKDEKGELNLEDKRALFESMSKFATVSIGGEIFSLTLKPLESLENLQTGEASLLKVTVWQGYRFAGGNPADLTPLQSNFVALCFKERWRWIWP